MPPLVVSPSELRGNPNSTDRVPSAERSIVVVLAALEEEAFTRHGARLPASVMRSPKLARTPKALTVRVSPRESLATTNMLVAEMCTRWAVVECYTVDY